MNILKVFIVAIFMTFIISPAFADSPKMLFVEYRFISPSIKEGTFEAGTTKLWRIGYKYSRTEESPDPVQNIHGLIIINEPDAYIINKFTQSGKHIVDRGETTDVHIPVFPIAKISKEIWKLEMGHENAFFEEHDAILTGTKIIEGITCNVYTIKINRIKLTLYKRQDNGNPLQVGIETDNIAYDIRYIKYENGLTPNFKLFEVPSGITIIDAN